MQCGAYISSINKDTPVIKSLVAFVMAMDMCVVSACFLHRASYNNVSWSTVLVWAWIWELFVDNFGTYVSPNLVVYFNSDS